MRHALAIVLLAGVALPSAAAAQVAPALAGTWTLNQEGGGRGGRGGIPGVPIATEVTIRLTPADVTVDTNTGSAHTVQTAVYKLDGSETTVPGPLGWTVKARAASKDSTLVVNTTRSLEGPNGPIGAEIIDVYSVSGNVLTIERTQGRNKQKLVYNRKL